MKYSRFLLKTLIVLFGIASVGIIICALFLGKYSKSSVDDDLINAVKNSDRTKFYCFDYSDRVYQTGEAKECENVSLTNEIISEYTSYDKFPQELIDAFVSVEDKRFFSHNGIDYRRSIGAVINYVLGGKKTFGGSTITQQLVKNLTGNDAFLIDRKLTEAFCAMDLEAKFEKSEIVEMYLNIINLSNGCRGVSAASMYYFSKDVGKLDLCECACLAAITNNPSKYDPLKHPELNKERRNIVLGCMLENGKLSQQEYESAIKEDICLNISKAQTSKINSWYIDAVIKDVISDFSSKYGVSKQTASVLLYKGGYKIYTAMDTKIQSILDDYFENCNNFPIGKNGEIPQASMIIIDPNSGDILGIAGAVGEKKGNRVQNYATDTKRPSGSAIKPLSVYAPAIDSGIINWSSIIEDSPIRTDKKTNLPWPSNANNKYLGDVNVKYGISNSLNTVAVRILNILGERNSYDFLCNKLNIKSLNEKEDIGEASLALGQHSHGITLRELTAGYSVFQNGIASNARTYYKVTDANERIILDNCHSPKEAISEESASIMTKLLQTVVDDGTASDYITLTDKTEVAGKTGTTQFSYDKYFIGYTPELLAGVWQGYEYPKTIDSFKGNYSIIVWDDIMNKIYEETEYGKITEFNVSNNVKPYSYNKKTGAAPEIYDDPEEIELGWFDIKRDIYP